MKIVSSLGEINYGSYDAGLDWNIQNYQVDSNGKSRTNRKFRGILRLNIFGPKLQAEIEFLEDKGSLRILLFGYDFEHDVYLEKIWLLTTRHFVWQGSPEKYQIQGHSLGLDLDIQCDSSGSLHFHFLYFDHYRIHFVSHMDRAQSQPLRSVNPFEFDTWSFSEKHALLDCSSINLTLDGNNYGFAAGFNVSYEWWGGYFPGVTKELRCQFWQCPHTNEDTALLSELSEGILRQPDFCLPELAGSLLMMGHDSCSSESAIWVGPKIRYLLPRVVPSFGRTEQLRMRKWGIGKIANLLPDLEWKISAGGKLSLNFQPYSGSDTSKLVFPQTQTEKKKKKEKE